MSCRRGRAPKTRSLTTLGDARARAPPFLRGRGTGACPAKRRIGVIGRCRHRCWSESAPGEPSRNEIPVDPLSRRHAAGRPRSTRVKNPAKVGATCPTSASIKANSADLGSIRQSTKGRILSRAGGAPSSIYWGKPPSVHRLDHCWMDFVQFRPHSVRDRPTLPRAQLHRCRPRVSGPMSGVFGGHSGTLLACGVRLGRHAAGGQGAELVDHDVPADARGAIRAVR